MGRNLKRHLTQDEFIGFILEDLPEALAEEVDRHLENCEACAKELEEFYTAQEDFPSERWAAERDVFIDRLQRKIFDKAQLKEPLREKLQEFLNIFESISYNIALGLSFTAHVPQDIESEDGTFGIFIQEEENGNIKVYLDSKALELEGVTIRLYAGKWFKDVRLTKVSDSQVGVKVLITRSEREAMPQGTVLRAKLVD